MGKYRKISRPLKGQDKLVFDKMGNGMKVRDVNNLNFMTVKGTISKKKKKKRHFQINVITFLVPPKKL